MHSLKAFAQSTLGELKDALVDAVGDDDEEEEEPQAPELMPVPPREPQLGPPQTETSTKDESARMEFQAVQQSPLLDKVLSKLNINAEKSEKWQSQLSVPDIATLSCWTLRQLLPLVTALDTNGTPSETQRLLTSFSDRYETLLSEHAALQGKARELSGANAALAQSAQQASSWKSAHGAAIARLEELSSENAELKERIKALRHQGLDLEQHQELLQKLAQKDAELLASTQAMERLQEVVDDQSTLMTKCVQLEHDLEAAKAAKVQAVSLEGASPAQAPGDREKEETQRYEHLLVRCQNAERELSETNAALEILLEEKSKRLEDQEHLVDRRLVTSMLALYHDHVSSGQRGLADLVLTQVLHILGGAPEETQRSQVKAAAAAAEARLAEPLSNAFLDFLEKETKESHKEAVHADVAQPSQLPPSVPPGVPLPLQK